MVYRKSTRLGFAACVVAGLLCSPALAQRPLLRNMEITNLDVAYTSGTMLLQQLVSKRAGVANDGESLLGEDVSVFVHPPDGGDEIKISSPRARYYFAAPPLGDNTPQLDLLEQVRLLLDSGMLEGAQPGVVDPVRGDFLLLAVKKTDEVILDMGRAAELRARNLIWSERLQHFLALSEFHQESRLPEGRLQIDGDAFVANRDFTEWQYPVMGAVPVRLLFVPSENSNPADGGLVGLAGGGEMRLTVSAGEKGETGLLKTNINPDADNQRIEARGRVSVKTPEFEMNAASIDYDPATSILAAKQNVQIKTPQLNANADQMAFNTATQELMLTGNPNVRQEGGGNSASFHGMNEFALRQQDNGSRLVQLAGDKQFEVKFESAANAESTSPMGQGMTLQVSPGTEQQGTVTTSIDDAGELADFRANGSVVLTSEQFSVRCDRLLYNSAEQRFEAIGNVFVQQTGIKADCDHLVYDMARGIMTMTGNPDITRDEAGGTTRIWGCDTFVMETRADGQADVTATGDNCQSKFTPKTPAGDAAATSESAGGFLGKLSGGGEVSFITGRTTDGTPGYFKITHNAAGEQIFEAKGDLKLDTPEFKLQARVLNYNEQQNRMTAEQSVVVRTPQIDATAGNMVYNTLTQEVRLTGNPRVIQMTPENRSEFVGMEIFSLQQSEGAEKLVELVGPREIQINIEPIQQTAATGNAGGRQGLQTLGDNLNIVVSPHPENQPRVRSLISETGELRTFTASGSIVLKSNRLDLRCDQMNYNSPAQRFEASGHVFVKQENIQADCGRLMYELDSGRIILTLDPEVVQYQADDIKTIQGCTEITVQPREGGNPDIITKGDACRNFITPITRNQPQAGPQAPQGPIEITPEQPQTVR